METPETPPEATPEKRGRGRPKGALNRKTMLLKGIQAPGQKDERTDAEIVTAIQERFKSMERVVASAASGTGLRAMMVRGAPGVGKTFTLERRLGELARDKGVKFRSVAGNITGVELFKLGYDYRDPGNVIILDDADSIFQDESALNVLKAMTDTKMVRMVSWLSGNPNLAKRDPDTGEYLDDDEKVPPVYEYNGSICFITNLDFTAIAEANMGRLTEHIKALLSRAPYIDLHLNTLREVNAWIRYIAIEGDLFKNYGITDSAVRDMLLKWFDENIKYLRQLSIREMIKLIELYKAGKDTWQYDATLWLIRDKR